MFTEDYAEALKKAQKAYRYSLTHGIYPYLPVLDETLSYTDVSSELYLGLIEVPLNLVVGTKTEGRTHAFANNFLPLMEERSEFATKWERLFDAHMNEGIREPIKAYEFMRRFYVVEGNKRVSVLKYLDAVSIPAYVTRILPQKDGSKEVNIYYEFLDFWQITSMYEIWFSEEGCFPRLLSLLGYAGRTSLNEEETRSLRTAYFRFRNAFKEKGGGRLTLTTGDAFLLYLEIYGYQELLKKDHTRLLAEIERAWTDFALYPSKPSIELVMQPESAAPRKRISRLLPLPAPPSHLKIAFLHDKTAAASSWTYGHELGRLHLEEALAGQVETCCFDNINSEEASLAAIEQAVADGCQVIFTTTPRLLGASLKAALSYPDLKILNCSLNTDCGHLRTYYGRLYEAKYLTGMLAGILSDTNAVGYIADYPITGMTANINAFALGLKTVNPRARLILEWSTMKGSDMQESFRAHNVSYVSGQDLITPARSSRRFGLYDIRDSKLINVASPIWHWGKFYERIVGSILDGSWRKEEQSLSQKSINYWWGLSSGMIDVICSSHIPQEARQLIEIIKREIAKGRLIPFSGDLYDQQGTLHNRQGETLDTSDIITQNWLLDNVVGCIPRLDQLIDDAKPIVQLQGVANTQQERT